MSIFGLLFELGLFLCTTYFIGTQLARLEQFNEIFAAIGILVESGIGLAIVVGYGVIVLFIRNNFSEKILLPSVAVYLSILYAITLIPITKLLSIACFVGNLFVAFVILSALKAIAEETQLLNKK